MITYPKISSVIRSWKYIREEFSQKYDIISGHKDDYRKEIVWQTRHKFVARIYLPEELGGGSIAYKYYTNARPVRFFMQHSLAYREGLGFYVAERLRIPTVTVLALGEKRFCGYLQSSFFISRFAEDYQPGSVLVQQENMGQKQRELLKCFIRKNLIFLARLHQAGFSHGGAHYNNFIWRLDGRGELQILWLDLATVRRFPPLGRRRKIKSDLRVFLNCFSLLDSEIREYFEFYKAECRKLAGKPRLEI